MSIWLVALALVGFAQRDIPARFPGGDQAYNEFLSQNLQFPEKALDAQASREIRVLIQIDTLGKVSVESFIFEYSGLGFEEEVKRFLASMPNWEPAIHNGEKANSQVILKFNFTYIDPNVDYDTHAYEYYEKSDVPPRFEPGKDSIERFVMGFLVDSLQLSFDTAYARLSIIINREGKIIDGQILESNGVVGRGYWLYALQHMPAWTPGTIRGKAVAVQHEIVLNLINDQEDSLKDN